MLFRSLTKLFFVNNYSLGDSVPIIKNILHFTYVHNYGAGFSLFQNQTLLFIVFAVLVIAAILYYYNKITKNYVLIGAALILSGAVGNLVDRLIFGYVIDFIDFRIWPMFNIADSAITIGAVLVMIYLWKN